MVDRVFWKESEAEATRDHCQNPIVAIAAIHRFAINGTFVEDPVDHVIKLAGRSLNVPFAREILYLNRVARTQPMSQRKHDHHLLSEQRQVIQARIGLPVGSAVDCRLGLRDDQPLLDRHGRAVDQIQFDVRPGGRKATEQLDQKFGRDGAHDCEAQSFRSPRGEILCLLLDGLGLLPDSQQVGLYDPAEFRQVNIGSFAVKQKSAKFLLQHLDRTSQGGLSDVALGSGPGKIQFLADGEKIANLMDLHTAFLSGVWRNGIGNYE